MCTYAHVLHTFMHMYTLYTSIHVHSYAQTLHYTCTAHTDTHTHTYTYTHNTMHLNFSLLLEQDLQTVGSADEHPWQQSCKQLQKEKSTTLNVAHHYKHKY